MQTTEKKVNPAQLRNAILNHLAGSVPAAPRDIAPRINHTTKDVSEAILQLIDDDLIHADGNFAGTTLYTLSPKAKKNRDNQTGGADEDLRGTAHNAKNHAIHLLSTKEHRKEGIHQLSTLYCEELKIITIEQGDEMRTYQDGVYTPCGERTLAKAVEADLAELASKHVLAEIDAKIRRMTYTPREKTEEPINKICLQNGILDLDTMQIGPHTPSTIFFAKLPVTHKPEADCPLIKKFLSEILPEDSIRVVQEMAGYCLYKGLPIQKAFMLIGSGANGKSVLINIIKAFLGAENTASIALQQLETNRFAISALQGKLANLFADLSKKALDQSGVFKMLVTGDQISAERKFQQQFFFTSYAKMVFSANELPRSPDESDAFFRRWVLINFPNQFTGEKADKRLLEKVTTPGELSGFLNWAIEGLKRLLEQGDFSSGKSIEETREEYVRLSDSVAAFVMARVLADPDGSVAKKDLFLAYTDYSREHGLPIVAENTFHRRLQGRVRVEDYRPLVDGRRVQYWKGVRILGVEEAETAVHDVGDVNAFFPSKYIFLFPSPFSLLFKPPMGSFLFFNKRKSLTLLTWCTEEGKSRETPPQSQHRPAFNTLHKCVACGSVPTAFHHSLHEPRCANCYDVIDSHPDAVGEEVVR